MTAARISQTPIEVLSRPAAPNARISQVTAEVLSKNNTHINAQVSQAVVEVISPAPNPAARIGQAVAEVIYGAKDLSANSIVQLDYAAGFEIGTELDVTLTPVAVDLAAMLQTGSQLAASLTVLIGQTAGLTIANNLSAMVPISFTIAAPLEVGVMLTTNQLVDVGFRASFQTNTINQSVFFLLF